MASSVNACAAAAAVPQHRGHAAPGPAPPAAPGSAGMSWPQQQQQTALGVLDLVADLHVFELQLGLLRQQAHKLAADRATIDQQLQEHYPEHHQQLIQGYSAVIAIAAPAADATKLQQDLAAERARTAADLANLHCPQPQQQQQQAAAASPAHISHGCPVDVSQWLQAAAPTDGTSRSRPLKRSADPQLVVPAAAPPPQDAALAPGSLLRATDTAASASAAPGEAAQPVASSPPAKRPRQEQPADVAARAAAVEGLPATVLQAALPAQHNVAAHTGAEVGSLPVQDVAASSSPARKRTRWDQPPSASVVPAAQQVSATGGASPPLGQQQAPAAASSGAQQQMQGQGLDAKSAADLGAAAAGGVLAGAAVATQPPLVPEQHAGPEPSAAVAQAGVPAVAATASAAPTGATVDSMGHTTTAHAAGGGQQAAASGTLAGFNAAAAATGTPAGTATKPSQPQGSPPAGWVVVEDRRPHHNLQQPPPPPRHLQQPPPPPRHLQQPPPPPRQQQPSQLAPPLPQQQEQEPKHLQGHPPPQVPPPPSQPRQQQQQQQQRRHPWEISLEKQPPPAMKAAHNAVEAAAKKLEATLAACKRVNLPPPGPTGPGAPQNTILVADAATVHQLVVMLLPATVALLTLRPETAGDLHNMPIVTSIQGEAPGSWQQSWGVVREDQLMSTAGIKAALIAVKPKPLREKYLRVVHKATCQPPEDGGLRYFLWRSQELLLEDLQRDSCLSSTSQTAPAQHLRVYVRGLAQLARVLATIYNLLLRGYPLQGQQAAGSRQGHDATAAAGAGAGPSEAVTATVALTANQRRVEELYQAAEAGPGVTIERVFRPLSADARAAAWRAVDLAAAATDAALASQPLQSAAQGVLADAASARQLVELVCPVATALAALPLQQRVAAMRNLPVEDDVPQRYKFVADVPPCEAQLLCKSGLWSAAVGIQPTRVRTALISAANIAPGAAAPGDASSGLLAFVVAAHKQLVQQLGSPVALPQGAALTAAPTVGQHLKQVIKDRVDLAQLVLLAYNLLERGHLRQQPPAAAAAAATAAAAAAGDNHGPALNTMVQQQEVQRLRFVFPALTSSNRQHAQAALTSWAHEVKRTPGVKGPAVSRRMVCLAAGARVVLLQFCPAAAALLELTRDTAGELHNLQVEADSPPAWQYVAGAQLQEAQLLTRSGLVAACAPLRDCSNVHTALQAAAAAAAPASSGMPGSGLLGFFCTAQQLLVQEVRADVVQAAGSSLSVGAYFRLVVLGRIYLAELLLVVYGMLKRGHVQQPPEPATTAAVSAAALAATDAAAGAGAKQAAGVEEAAAAASGGAAAAAVGNLQPGQGGGSTQVATPPPPPAGVDGRQCGVSAVAPATPTAAPAVLQGAALSSQAVVVGSPDDGGGASSDMDIDVCSSDVQTQTQPQSQPQAQAQAQPQAAVQVLTQQQYQAPVSQQLQQHGQSQPQQPALTVSDLLLQHQPVSQDARAAADRALDEAAVASAAAVRRRKRKNSTKSVLVADLSKVQKLVGLYCPVLPHLMALHKGTSGALGNLQLCSQDDKWVGSSAAQLQVEQLTDAAGLRAACSIIKPHGLLSHLHKAVATSKPAGDGLPGPGLNHCFFAFLKLFQQQMKLDFTVTVDLIHIAGDQLRQIVLSRAYWAELLVLLFTLLKRGTVSPQQLQGVRAAAVGAGAQCHGPATVLLAGPAATAAPAAISAAAQVGRARREEGEVEEGEVQQQVSPAPAARPPAPLAGTAAGAGAAAAAPAAQPPALLAGGAAAAAAAAPTAAAVRLIGPGWAAGQPQLRELPSAALTPGDLAAAAEALKAAQDEARMNAAHVRYVSQTGIYKNWRVVADAPTARRLLGLLVPGAEELARLRQQHCTNLHQGLLIQRDQPIRWKFAANMVVQEAQLLDESGMRAACNLQSPQALRRRLYAALDASMQGTSSLLSWFWAAHALFVDEWHSEACGKPLSKDDAGVLLKECIQSRTRFARLLIMVYNLLLRGHLAEQQPQQQQQQQQPQR